MARSSALSLGRPAPKGATEPKRPRPFALLRTVHTERSGAVRRQERVLESERDRALVVRARAGDEAAFAELVGRYRPRAFAIAFGFVRDEEDASDIVQEAFLRVYRGLERFNGAATFFSWLYRIVKNLSIDRLRRPAWRREVAGELGEQLDAHAHSHVLGADPEDALRRRELAAVVGAAIDALPAYHRAVLVMRELEGMSYEEMAKAAGVSSGTIMSRLFHARKKLQRALLACYVEHRERLPSEEGATRSR